MSEFLIEIYSEEIPARMQEKAALDFKNLFTDFFTKQNISFSESHLQSFVTPRRLVFLAKNIAEFQIIPASQKIGPKADSNPKAIEGFLKSVGANKISDLKKITRDNGEYYVFDQKESKINTVEILSKHLPVILQKMSGMWPKSMKWQIGNNYFTWVRPIRSILCLFENKIISFEFAGVQSSNKTIGHLLLSNQELSIKNFADYEEKLAENFVILDALKRKEIIISQIKSLCKEINYSLIDNLEENNPLLNEVVGLAEYPVAMLGKIDEKFMSLPAEVLILTVKNHQKYFCLRGNKENLAPFFIFISNIKADAKSQEKIIADNQKVLRARLSDAKFFIDEDLKIPLLERLPGLKNIIFHEKLGSVYGKVKRLEVLNKFISMWIPHCNLALAERVANLSKNDLITKTVAELPELQGKIGSYYAKSQNEPDEIFAAIYEQYLPVSTNGELPQTPLGIMLSIADKMDSICGLFLAGEKPTSSKDPFALRRAALGIIRIILNNHISFPLKMVIDKSINSFSAKTLSNLLPEKEEAKIKDLKNNLSLEITTFFIERLRFLLKENLTRVDIVNEIIEQFLVDAKKDKKCDLLVVSEKALFINRFVSNSANQNVIELYKRAANIVTIEEKKDGKEYDSKKPHPMLLRTKYDRLLNKKVKEVAVQIEKLLKLNKHEEAMLLLAKLENPLKDFFDNVIVNCEEGSIRVNRLLILGRIRNLFNSIFNFSKIEFPVK